MTQTRTRLDRRLVDDGLTETRSRAQALIMAGKVLVNGHVQTKSGHMVDPDDAVGVSEGLPFVSRGGFKLDHALAMFHVDPTGWTVVDVGASTGGFTDCWLQHGASRVFAVDVGYGQLDWRLRQDERVVVMERTNARYLQPGQFSNAHPLDGASIDASFIGLNLLLGPVKTLLSSHGVVIALVKPQFEAGPGNVGKGGVVRDPEIHKQVIETVVSDAQAMGYTVRGLAASPIRGPEGNIEFLLYLGFDPEQAERIDISAVVDAAWKAGSTDG